MPLQHRLSSSNRLGDRVSLRLVFSKRLFKGFLGNNEKHLNLIFHDTAFSIPSC